VCVILLTNKQSNRETESSDNNLLNGGNIAYCVLLTRSAAFASIYSCTIHCLVCSIYESVRVILTVKTFAE